jgi:hypothetical protein
VNVSRGFYWGGGRTVRALSRALWPALSHGKIRMGDRGPKYHFQGLPGACVAQNKRSSVVYGHFAHQRVLGASFWGHPHPHATIT